MQVPKQCGRPARTGCAGRSGATKCDAGSVRTISQPELCNDNAEIIRGVEQGESYTVTRRGAPVARLVLIGAATDLRCDRPAKGSPVYTAQTRVSISTPTRELLDDLRGDR